ncbi:hypothetical protein PORY_000779 [Pneumocystis oryctolagi]|uniref:Uncharacterized protein n=1 Tax=Pneumocystis oryctolagi TaxID=42067 RepID=A0ACB7CIW4_9ASCO|nr:hypothetical protein PORY_000779 [Pneumocystis oryctolagi]
MSKHWSFRDEEEIRKIFLKNLHAACSNEIQKFAECATGKTFSVMWKCRHEKNQMKECMRLNSHPKYYNHAREMYMELQSSKKQTSKSEKSA